MPRPLIATLILIVTLTHVSVPLAAQTQTGWALTPYSSWTDSPFTNILFSYFHLEDFEEGRIIVPGVRMHRGPQILGDKARQTRFVDSVDEDDGAVDGSGSTGHSVWSADHATIRFSFDADLLCGLPTHVGVVWTDAAAARNAVGTLSAFDTSGVRLAEVHTVLQADSVITGTVSEDTFLGVHAPEGIAEVRLSNRLFNFEIDHLQFGRDCGGQPCEACE